MRRRILYGLACGTAMPFIVAGLAQVLPPGVLGEELRQPILPSFFVVFLLMTFGLGAGLGMDLGPMLDRRQVEMPRRLWVGALHGAGRLLLIGVFTAAMAVFVAAQEEEQPIGSEFWSLLVWGLFIWLTGIVPAGAALGALLALLCRPVPRERPLP